MDINTDDNITVQTAALQALENIGTNLSTPIYSVGKCKNQTGSLSYFTEFHHHLIMMNICFVYLVPIQNVTACFLLDLCDLCGGSVKRGVCLPQLGVSKCQCFSNTDDPSNPYTGDFCYPTPSQSLSTPRWTPIVIGVLAGLAGIFCSITCCLLALAAWRRRRQHSPDE